LQAPKQVTRYAGLDASVHQSGEQHWQGHISKNGSPLLRTALVEAAHSVARYDTGPLGQFYQRKRRHLGHRKAIVARTRLSICPSRRHHRSTMSWSTLLGVIDRIHRTTVGIGS
jgi:transposase